MSALLILCLALVLVVETYSQVQPMDEILTVAQRNEIFGKDSSLHLPPVEYVSLTRHDVIGSIRGGYRRPANVERYSMTYAGETIMFTLRQNTDLLTPGCLIKHHRKNGTNILYPCARSLSTCMFVGNSDTHADTWAAVNTCRGMKGIVSIRNTSLIIAPLRKKAFGNYGNESSVHVMYRYVSDKICMDGPATNLQIVHRNKRAVRHTKYIEARVTVDPSIHSFHGNESEAYVQTIFNIAGRLFEDSTLDLDFKLTLAEIHIYESYDEIKTLLSEDAESTLTNYCNWTAEHYTTYRDCNVLLTRMNLVYKGVESTVGLAKRPGMCENRRNCALVEDTGPASGIVLAHELGHLLGMKHDNDTTCKDDQGIMGVGVAGQNAYRWTRCSREAALHFLNGPTAYCLLNYPEGEELSVGFNNEAPLPGTIYTREDQCKLLLGKEATYCNSPTAGVCNELSCRKARDASCLAYSLTSIDGTDCNNTRTWCISGQCVPINQSTPAVDGQWSAWQHEEPCSRTCGGGVKITRRTCTNPLPQYGGKYCTGIGVKATLCNPQDCLGDFKTEQCIEFVKKNSKPEIEQWKPIYNVIGQDSCAIACQLGQSVLDGASSHDYYKDGTDCELGWDVHFGRCVVGQCKKFGCDGVMDSNKTYDKCGNCNGTGAGCLRTFGVYNKDAPSNNFTTAVTIPTDSYNIKVNQSNKWCFLSILVNGKRPFNKNPNDLFSGEFRSDGVKIRYTKTPERIEIKGPTLANVEIQVYRKFDYTHYAGVTPDIEYEYYQRRTVSATRFHWSTQYTPCSKTCGTGYETPTVRCVDLSTGPVDDSLCDVALRPNELQKPCNTHACPSTWVVSHLGACSVTCGPDGTRTRAVYCGSYNNGTIKRLEDLHCASETKPSAVQACSDNPCPAVWKPEPWTECSKSCGMGYRMRVVRCYLPNGTLAQGGECNVNKRPPLKGRCSNGFCGERYGRNCKDAIANLHYCKEYGVDMCYGNFSPWAEVNCERWCGLCSTGDDPRCPTWFNDDNDFCKNNKSLGNQVCPAMCKYPETTTTAMTTPSSVSSVPSLSSASSVTSTPTPVSTTTDCIDQPQCQSYDLSVCQNLAFSKKNCPRMCGKCGAPCKDIEDCTHYSHDLCNDSAYKVYMDRNCQKHCGICTP